MSKITYAQSSDIKLRTYLEYRRDMKKKAIAELEFLPFLRALLADKCGDDSLQVVKHGTDAELWFAPAGGTISREPDYKATKSDGGEFLYEFQYAEAADNLAYFDFKVSKVGATKKGVRTPHDDREFFYVVKPGAKYAFLSPRWIMENGNVAAVPAWGSRPAYRVPHDTFTKILQDGGKKMRQVIRAVDDKNKLLEFQHCFLDGESEKMSRRLQQGVDEKKIVKITPGTPEGFYEVCFLLDKLNKSPVAPGVWMVYLLSMLGGVKTPAEWARFVFALDFLYAKIENVRDNEKAALVCALRDIESAVSAYCWQGAPVSPHESSAEETRQMLFVINLLEDLRQNVIVCLGVKLPKVAKIFESVPDVAGTATFVRGVTDNAAD